MSLKDKIILGAKIAFNKRKFVCPSCGNTGLMEDIDSFCGGQLQFTYCSCKHGQELLKKDKG